jgi:hypothetical protein
MKAVQYLLFFLALAVAENLFAQSTIGAVRRVDLAGHTLTVAGPSESSSTFRVNAGTEISLDGEPATLSGLKVGTLVIVSTGDMGDATRIASPAEVDVRVPATANESAPIAVATVSQGQRVTIVPKQVRWCGGGSKKGVSTGWTGYDQGGKGIPWMALVAAVGDNKFWAKGPTLTFIAPSDGPLDLYANDEKPEDNTGEAVLTVTISGN